MTDATPHLGLPLIAASQAQKHVTHNEALGLLDALVQLACLDKDLVAPPPSPSEGDRYLLAAASPAGAWAGLGGQVVRFADGVWTGSVPRPGWFAYVIDEADLYIFDGSLWTSFRRAITAIQLTSRLGINTTPDGTNRLAVKSDAALLSWDDVTPGSGDMRLSVSKQTAARDAALVFQTGYSARALLGTLAGDDFTLKVSADGAAFATALTASAATGGIDFASAETVLAGAATTDLGGAGTRRVVVTGTAAIASFGASPNRERFVRFAGAATLTHDPARLVLPTRANILAAADDTCIATSDASGNWRVRHYQRADGTSLVGGAVSSVAGRTGAVTLAASDVSGAAPLASPALTGLPTAPTAAAKDNSTKLATTAYADRGDAALIARSQVNDAAYAILAADRTVAVTALTAARTLTLPAASAFPQGATLTVVDESGACSAANALSLVVASAPDTVNGGPAAYIAQPYGYLALQSNGAGKWTIVDAPGNLAGFRNRIRNGTFAVNQRGVSGTVNLGAGAYGHDGWKAGASGAAYTVAAAANGDATVTGTGSAANTVLQVIEGGLYLPEGGIYVLSWVGTATARAYQGSAAGSYGAGTPVTVGGQTVNVLAVAGVTAGTNLTVEFNIAGGLAVRSVQLEPGAAATPFERRDDELRRCQRYYETGNTYVYASAYTGGASASVAVKMVPKRASPTVSQSQVQNGNFTYQGVAVNSTQDLLFYGVSSSGSATIYYQFTWAASAEL